MNAVLIFLYLFCFVPLFCWIFCFWFVVCVILWLLLCNGKFVNLVCSIGYFVLVSICVRLIKVDFAGRKRCILYQGWRIFILVVDWILFHLLVTCILYLPVAEGLNTFPSVPGIKNARMLIQGVREFAFLWQILCSKAWLSHDLM